MSEHKFYIDTQGNDDEAYLDAIKFSSEIAEKDNDIKRVVLLVHTKNNTGWFERVFGGVAAKQLFKGVTIKGLKPPYKLETKITYKDGTSASDIVITCGWDSDDVFKIDDYTSAKYIIAIPWIKENLTEWVQTWGAKELRGKAKKSYLLPSCIIQKAMEDLTSSINMATALSHPSDEKLAKTYILALNKYEESLRSDIIAGYLIKSLGWGTEQVKQVKKLIDTFNAGRHFQGGDRLDLKRNYDRWKKACQ